MRRFLGSSSALQKDGLDKTARAKVKQASRAIRPALLRFYGALDQGQKVRFAEMS